MNDEIIKDESTIYYLTFADDFAVIVGSNNVHSIRAYPEPGQSAYTAWLIAYDINGNVLMRINSAYVQLIGYHPLPGDDNTAPQRDLYD